MTISATSPSSRLHCGPYRRTFLRRHQRSPICIRQGQAGVSAITRRPNAFLVPHELGWPSTRLRPGPPFRLIRNNSIVKLLQRGIESSASGCISFALIPEMKVNLKKTMSKRMVVVVVVALMNLITLTYPRASTACMTRISLRPRR